MKRIIISTLIIFTSTFTSVNAGIPVIDVGNIAQGALNIIEQTRQYQQMLMEYRTQLSNLEQQINNAQNLDLDWNDIEGSLRNVVEWQKNLDDIWGQYEDAEFFVGNYYNDFMQSIDEHPFFNDTSGQAEKGYYAKKLNQLRDFGNRPIKPGDFKRDYMMKHALGMRDSPSSAADTIGNAIDELKGAKGTNDNLKVSNDLAIESIKQGERELAYRELEAQKAIMEEEEKKINMAIEKKHMEKNIEFDHKLTSSSQVKVAQKDNPINNGATFKLK